MFKKEFSLLFIPFLLIGAGCSTAVEIDVEPILDTQIEEGVVAEEVEEWEEEAEVVEEAVDEVDEEEAMDEEEVQATSGSYLDYSESTLNAVQAAGDRVVLFFYAPWCPYCRVSDAELLRDSERIPFGVTVLKTDYDTEKELKNKYGVKFQDTFVLIDSDGDALEIWTAGGLDELIKRTQ